MTVRKNFLLDDEIAKHLEEIAKKENITQTDVIKNMIEEKYEKYAIEEKLKAFRSIIPMPPGSLVGKSIQSIKAEMGSKI
jgi:macrodomain Ter protein organizer (MatP/YcbG family)